jgi:ABC-type cobalamin/Fe3+-siderophores transport system ATPase subunit
MKAVPAADFWGSAFDYVMLGRYPHSRSAWKAVLAALHEPGHAARHCGFSVLLYDAGRASLGRSSDMLTQANLEALYRCRLEAAGPQHFSPS